MFKLIRLLWKFAPHLVMIICGLGCVAGLVALFGKSPPSSPVPMTIAEAQRKPVEELPLWLEVSDGYLDWSEAYTVVKEKKSGEVTDHEHVIVPLTGSGGVSAMSHKDTLLLVSFPWDDFLSLFPKEAAELRSRSGAGLPRTPCKVTFEPISAATEFAFGIKHKILQKFETAGFTAICAVRPNSKPLSKAGGAGLAVTMLVLGGGGFLWLRKRRQTSLRETRDKLTGSAMSGFRQGLREAVESAVAHTAVHHASSSTADQAHR